MSVVCPTVLAETPDDYADQVERLTPFAERVHIDLADGDFAPTQSVRVDEISWPKNWQVDIHVMYRQPQSILAELVAKKPSMIILHAEAEGDVATMLAQIKQAGVKAGIALLKPTVADTVQPLIAAADHVLIFSGDLGHFGGTADMLQIEKVRKVRALNPQVEIGWDGGANLANAYTLSLGGVKVINVGAAISQAEAPAEAYKQLVEEANSVKGMV
jgi:ribulose-phosphate 3-epimerase